MTREEALKALADCRERINALDARILELLNERTRVVEEIGRIKREFQMPVYEPKREEEVFKNIREHNTGPMAQEAARRIFERIIDEMRTLQKIRMEAARDGE
ncbi:MAG TPA: chorismate mutase [Bryobacteraceae bacterium]|nr:chorismate mutase [Bryobacteraceae bacterium]